MLLIDSVAAEARSALVSPHAEKCMIHPPLACSKVPGEKRGIRSMCFLMCLLPLWSVKSSLGSTNSDYVVETLQAAGRQAAKVFISFQRFCLVTT